MRAIILSVFMVLSACSVGPDVVRHSTPVGDFYRITAEGRTMNQDKRVLTQASLECPSGYVIEKKMACSLVKRRGLVCTVVVRCR